MHKTTEIIILMADDDEDDVMLTKKALKQCKILNKLVSVHDGQELMDYLKYRGDYSDPSLAPRPGLILLDLNMPRKDGREALREIKSDEKLKNIPVVIFTTSKAEEDVYRSYKLGVNSFITKPVKFEELSSVIASLGNYWFKIVKLPPNEI